jgi:hypothetical protein
MHNQTSSMKETMPIPRTRPGDNVIKLFSLISWPKLAGVFVSSKFIQIRLIFMQMGRPVACSIQYFDHHE